MNSTPLFSLLLANYNNAPFLNRCLESVYDQTYANWEIVFVDDCSADNSMEIISKRAESDKRIRVFKNELNKGCGFTKARCAELASGELCGFLDTDDALTPNALEIMAERHLAQQNASIIFSKHYHCDRNLKIKDISDEEGKIFTSHLSTPMINHFATFKKNLYDKTEGIDPYMKRAVDQDLYLKMEEQGEVVFIPEPLYYYRHNNNSISLDKNEYKAHAWHIYANSAACKRRNLSLDDYCVIIKPGKMVSITLKMIKLARQIQYKLRKIFRNKQS